ncbi:MAG: hypothetical protein GY737_28315, partial [Desulfobacteraceae bacterium]|nr:hypothetical protein [Desulfobacteraceae bacterium]
MNNTRGGGNFNRPRQNDVAFTATTAGNMERQQAIQTAHVFGHSDAGTSQSHPLQQNTVSAAPSLPINPSVSAGGVANSAFVSTAGVPLVLFSQDKQQMVHELKSRFKNMYTVDGFTFDHAPKLTWKAEDIAQGAKVGLSDTGANHSVVTEAFAKEVYANMVSKYGQVFADSQIQWFSEDLQTSMGIG